MKPYTQENALRRRSTDRLLTMLSVAIGTECKCDSYHGYTCGKHDRIRQVSRVLEDRGQSPFPFSNGT